MKIRSSFVSNSSTTSFIILGWKLSEDQLKNVCEKKKITLDKEDDDTWGMMEKLINRLKERYTITGLLDDGVFGIGYKNECDETNDISQKTLMDLKKESTKLARELKIMETPRMFYGSTRGW